MTSHHVVVSASPFLTNSYYFDRNEYVTFKVRMSFNGTNTGVKYKDLKLTITSEWLDLAQGSINKDQFDAGVISGSSMVLDHNELKDNEVVIANVSGVVKPSIGPLAKLELKMKLNAKKDGTQDTIEEYEFVSSPTIYGVFPEVNVTGLSSSRKFISTIFVICKLTS